jgi:acetyl esterase/lipase
MQREADEGGLVGLRMLSQHIEAEVEEIDADGVRVYQVTPAGVSPDDPSVYFDIHGGALVQGGGEFCKELAKIMARMMGARVWSVDYRLPPDHRYPAPLDDCVTAYRALLHQSRPENVIVGGASAGGNLAAATILRARDEGLAMPVAAVILTPQIDLTECGDSFRTLLGVDTALTGSLMPARRTLKQNSTSLMRRPTSCSWPGQKPRIAAAKSANSSTGTGGVAAERGGNFVTGSRRMHDFRIPEQLQACLWPDWLAKHGSNWFSQYGLES